MKKSTTPFILIYIYLVNINMLSAQSALDPYRNYVVEPLGNNYPVNGNPVYPYFENLPPLQNKIYKTYDIKSNEIPVFTGEYEISLFDFFWHASANIAFPMHNDNNNNLNAFNNYYNDFKIELVSFPFTNDYCVTNGCASCSSTTRNMYMPAGTFANNKWGNFLYRETGTGEIPSVLSESPHFGDSEIIEAAI